MRTARPGTLQNRVPGQGGRAGAGDPRRGQAGDQEGKPEGRGPPPTRPGAMAEGQGTRGTQTRRGKG